VANLILRDFNLDHCAIAEALAQHIQGRLDIVNKNMEEIGGYIFGDSARSCDLVCQLAQCTDDELRAPGPPADFLTRGVAIGAQVLDGWRSDALELVTIPDAIAALRVFATQDGRMAAFEERISDIVNDIDRQIQDEIDRRRGK
jgi:hypothetical protein